MSGRLKKILSFFFHFLISLFVLKFFTSPKPRCSISSTPASATSASRGLCGSSFSVRHSTSSYVTRAAAANTLRHAKTRDTALQHQVLPHPPHQKLSPASGTSVPPRLLFFCEETKWFIGTRAAKSSKQILSSQCCRSRLSRYNRRLLLHVTSTVLIIKLVIGGCVPVDRSLCSPVSCVLCLVSCVLCPVSLVEKYPPL